MRSLMGSVKISVGLRSVRIVDVNKLKQLLAYDPLTGVFTRLRTGALADRQHTDNYRAVKVGGGLYLSHRLAWLFVYGKWPAGEIDHVNGDRTDNRIQNLRVVTRAENNQNIRTAKRNNKSSGLLGVTHILRNNKWRAQIMVARKKLHIGLYDSPQDAHNAYVETKRRLHAGCTI